MMNATKIIKLCAMAVLMTLSACGGSTDKRPTLCVSIEPQRCLLEELAGDKYDVVTLMTTGADPETYEPTMSQRMALSNALAYFTVGYLPFEDALARQESTVPVYNTSQGIDVAKGTHAHGHSDADHTVDPHVWTSLRNGKVIAANMRDALVNIDPDNAELYRSRYAGIAHRLDSLDAEVSRRLSSGGVHAFAVWHPSLTYYARDYGLHQLSAGSESKEMSPADMRRIIDEARADSVRVFFFQKEFDSRQARVFNDEIGSRMFTISPLDYNWEQQIIDITNELTH